MSNYDKALHARTLYRSGAISRAEAMAMMAGYIEEFNAKSRELAKKYGQRPRLFSFSAFCR